MQTIEDIVTYVVVGPFIIRSGRMDILSSPSWRTADLSETALLWTTRFLIRRMPSHISLSSLSRTPISLEASIMSLRYILPPFSDALARTGESL